MLDGEDASFSIPLPSGEILNCVVKVINEDDLDSAASPKISVEFESDVFTILFNNFKSSLGHHTSVPVRFGASDAGEEFSFLASISKLKSFTKIDIQMMLESVGHGGAI